MPDNIVKQINNKMPTKEATEIIEKVKSMLGKFA